MTRIVLDVQNEQKANLLLSLFRDLGYVDAQRYSCLDKHTTYQ